MAKKKIKVENIDVKPEIVVEKKPVVQAVAPQPKVKLPYWKTKGLI